MPSPLTAEVKNQAKVLYLAGKHPVTIGQELGIKKQTIYQWVKRGGWLDTRTGINTQVHSALSSTVTKTMTKEAVEVRRLLSREIASQALLLAQNPAKEASELFGAKQGRADVVRVLADASAKIFGDPSQDGGIGDDLRVLDVEEVKDEPPQLPPST